MLDHMMCRSDLLVSKCARFIGRLLIALLLRIYVTAEAAEPSRYSAGKCANGELKFVDGLPVVTTGGTPEQIGTALGTLYKHPLGELMGKQDEVARGFGLKQAPGVLVKMSRLAVPAFPDSQRRELQSMSAASGANLDTLEFANIVYEIAHFPACSSLAVEPGRSAIGETDLWTKPRFSDIRVSRQIQRDYCLPAGG